MYDIIVVGLGPGGVTSCIYAKRSNLNVLGIEANMIGGELNYIDRIDNYPGLLGIQGSDFSYKLNEELDQLEVPYVYEKVEKINPEENYFRVKTNKKEYTTKKIVIATGRIPKALGLPKEDEFIGRGISRCAVCDGAFFKGLPVAVVGGGNAALQEAIYLANMVDKVYLIHRRNQFKASPVLVDKVKSIHNIICIMEEEVVSINGIEKLESITLKSGRELSIAGLFIYIGYKPSISCLEDLQVTNKEGYAIVNDRLETSTKGLYAIGDAIEKDYYQVLTAASDAVVATLNIAKDIEGEK